jgi:crossover junction endodeoxyribonuclease RuvC
MTESTPTSRIILGVDPGLQRCGWGVIVSDGPRLSFLACGVIKPDIAAGLGPRLLTILDGLTAVIAAHRPHEAAVEETYVNANARAALALGQARGAAMIAPAKAGLPIGEYPPATIKKAVVGTGSADKDQVQFMVRRLLPAAGAMGADAADALAVAICHAAHASARRKTGG